MFLAQLILANPAISMIIGMSIVVLAITALEVRENGFNKESVKAIAPTDIICSIVALVVLRTN